MEDPLHKLMRKNASMADLMKCLESKKYKKQSKEYEYISMANIKTRLVLRAKKPGSDEVSLTADVMNKKDWIRLVELFQHFLNNMEIKQLRFCGVNDAFDEEDRYIASAKYSFKDKLEDEWTSSGRSYKIDELIYDLNTEIYDYSLIKKSLPRCLTLKGRIEYLHHKVNYVVRLDNIEISRKFADLEVVKYDFFDLVEKSLPNLVLSPQRIMNAGLPSGSEIFVRYHWTPKMMWNLVQHVQDRGGFRTVNGCMTYSMQDGNQLVYKIGHTGVYCAITPAGWNSARPSVFEAFLIYDDEDTAKYFEEWADEPGYTTMSWNNLPLEMKMACIKTMDFKTRTCLRAAGRAEMNLITDPETKNDEQKELENGGVTGAETQEINVNNTYLNN